MVWDHHELSKRRQTEEKMVWTVQVGDLKLDGLSPEVLRCTKDHILPDSAHWNVGEAGYDAMKGCPTWLKLALANALLYHGLTVQDVDAATYINEGTSEEARVPRSCHYGIHHQHITARI